MIVAALCAMRGASAAPPPIDEPVHPISRPIAQPPTGPNGPLHPHLPLDGPTPSATTAPSQSSPFGAPAQWRVDPTLPRPKNVPKLSQFLTSDKRGHFSVRTLAPMGMAALQSRLRAAENGKIHPMAADGSTIILTGDSTNLLETDITLSYGAVVYPDCESMPKANYNKYQFVLYPPDGSGPYASGNMSTDGSGNCTTTVLSFNLSTPFGGYVNYPTLPGTNGAPYPGVWVMAMVDAGVAGTPIITETNIISQGSFNFTTYADLGLATQTADYNAGGLMVVAANGLNPAHSYAVGWVLTAGSGLPCAYSVPWVGAGKKGVCFRGAVAGVQAFGGNLQQWWGPTSNPSSSTAANGTYDVELYDTTTSDMIGHQQISVEPSSVAWTLTPVNNVTNATPPPGLNYNNTFATDGLTDQSVSGLTYSATGLLATGNGHNLTLSISNPNGVILTNPTGWPGQAASPAVTQAGTTLPATTVQFPLNAFLYTAIGPTNTPFAPNIMTAQLYDQTTGSVVGSKSFTVLGYNAKLNWSGSTIQQAAPAPGTNATLTVTNTAGSYYGPWNGDAISGVMIATNPADGISLSLASTTTTDTANNAWTITQVGVGTSAVIVATPNQRNVGIPVGGQLNPFQINVQIPAGKCMQPCSLPTQILPLHGISYSAANSASNAPQVINSTVNPSTVNPTVTWAVQSESATANMAARAPTFNQLTYQLGVAGSPTSDYYVYNLTLNNVTSPGSHKLMDVEFTFPNGLDFNQYPPTWNVAPGGGWTIATVTGYPGLAGQNVFALTCAPSSTDSCGIAVGTSKTFSIRIPLFQLSFAEQPIPTVANFDGGCPSGCTATAYNLGSSGTQNGIANLTNVDSTSLGSFSLNPSLMTMAFTPNTVGTGIPTTATMTFTNTSTSQDPNPDYVDQLNLVFPAANNVNPASITVPAGWTATQVSPQHWRIALCASPTNSTPCSTNETATAIAPGGQLQMTLNYPSAPYPTAGTYNVQWYATGANGGEDTRTVVTNASITFSSTTGSVAITNIAGAAIPNGTEPQVGTDTTANGNAYTFLVTNTGSTNVDTVNVTIPNQTRSATSGGDSSGTYWTITTAPVVTIAGAGSSGTGGTCSGALNAAQYSSASLAGNGAINLTGCTIKPGGTATIVVNMKAPYLIGNDFIFQTNVHTGATNVVATPTYSAANAVKIILNGTLTLLMPNLGWVAPNSPNAVTPAAGSGATPSTSCVSCQILAGSPQTIDFGVFNGTFTATDILDASVWSDANTPNSWVLYVTTSPGTNPSNMLSTQVDTAHSSSAAGYTVNAGAMSLVSTTTPGLQLATYSGAVRHGPLDSIMNFQIATGGNTSPQTVTLTYTLVFN